MQLLKKYTAIEKMLMLCIAFTMMLLLIRIIRTHERFYAFYVWNIFLAIVPYLFSRKLSQQTKLSFKVWCIIGGWLLFFPNAPYIITDIFHYKERPPMPKWFDLLLVTSAAWNGLLLGIVSLMQVERFLLQHIKQLYVSSFVLLSMLLCGYGVYIGRFLRFNSWDIVTNPDDILYASAHHILQPWNNMRLWGFTVLFAVMLSLLYFTLKQINTKKVEI